MSKKNKKQHTTNKTVARPTSAASKRTIVQPSAAPKKTVVRPAAKTTKAQLKLNFESADVSYSSQFSVQATSNEVFFNFAASLFPGANPGEIILPIHTRIAMNYVNTKRLLAVLAETVKKYEQEYGEIKDSMKTELPVDKGSSMSKKTAAFPKMKR